MRLIRFFTAALLTLATTSAALALDPGDRLSNTRDPSTNFNKLGVNALKTRSFLPTPAVDVTSAPNRLSLESFLDCPSVSQEVTKTSACANHLAPNGKTFMWNLGLVGDASSPTGDKVTLYTAYEGHAGTAGGWARNALTKMFKGSGGSIVDEIDLNNFDCDVGGPVHPGNCEKPKSAIGLLITGLSRNEHGVGGAARAAIVITTPQENLWRHGLSFEGPAIVDSELFTNSNSVRVFDVRGSHLFGLDMNSATFTGSAISMSYGASNHHIAWRGGTGIAFNIATDSNLGALILSAGAGGNTLFKTDGSWAMPKSLSVAQGLTVSGLTEAQGGLNVRGGTINALGAANNISLSGAAAGGAPTILAYGADANLSLNLQASGTGVVNVSGNGIAVNGTTAIDGGRSATFAGVVSNGSVRAVNLPTVGTAKGTVCVTAAGDFYVKTSSGACL